MAVAAFDDAVRSVHLAYATGSTTRAVSAPGGAWPGTRSGLPRDRRRRSLETDDAFRARIQLAPEGPSAGTRDAYRLAALNADGGVRAVDVWWPASGIVSIAVQAHDAEAEAEIVSRVRSAVGRDDVRRLTDVLDAFAAPVSTYAIEADLYVRPGPDLDVIEDLARSRIAAAAEARRLPGRDVPRSALIHAAAVSGVDRVVLLAPAADLVADPGDVLAVASISLRMLAHDG